ncbi:hypothetical protein BDN67DRAFT_972024 [Paxillus ammoniavirescens]|nr:hypothetical protein BDN67DRAFT_972024 [Paxillus ammoniavirescens]
MPWRTIWQVILLPMLCFFLSLTSDKETLMSRLCSRTRYEPVYLWRSDHAPPP